MEKLGFIFMVVKSSNEGNNKKAFLMVSYQRGGEYRK
jgi:hypothetical protein